MSVRSGVDTEKETDVPVRTDGVGILRPLRSRRSMIVETGGRHLRNTSDGDHTPGP